jgi:hypothetical protein
MGVHVGKECMLKPSEDNTIRITRGDTLDRQVSIEIWDEEAGDYVEFIPSEGDSLRFALKGSANDSKPIMTVVIPIDTLNLRIEADEMETLRARREPYWYDIELTVNKTDGKINRDTIIEWTPFYVTEEAD